MTKLTIGLPFFNSEQTLSLAIRSVFAQSFQDWELLLIDDGSTDRSLEIARAVDDPRVRVLSDGVNRQLSYRLNEITDHARGQFIARMDADDVMLPERLRCQVQYLERHPRIDVVGTAVYIIDGENHIVGRRGDQPLALNPHDVLLTYLYFHPTLMGQAAWFRANPYDAQYVRAEDRELWCRTFLDARTEYGSITQPLLLYREQGSVTLQKRLASYRTNCQIIRDYGPRMIGWRSTQWEIAKMRGKGVAARAIWGLGLQSRLISRKLARPSQADHLAAEEEFRKVLETPVPGLDAHDPGRSQSRRRSA